MRGGSWCRNRARRVSGPTAPAGLDPARPEAWALAIEARKGWKDDEAMALAAEAVARFPGFPVTPADLQHEDRDVREARAEQQRAADADADLLAKARAALDARRDEEVVELTGALLDRQPGHFETRVLRAFALQRLNRLEEALAVYQQLAIQQGGAVRVQWVHQVEGRLEVQRRRHPALGATAGPHPGRSDLRDAMPIQPRVSWGSVAGEFLEDHWQKLILCLAVLLIVVSSKVGAYQLLGPKLWSPLGKCLLALVYTAMFAGFGSGLVRWGAERAGRMMLMTTLIVVPVNFMLAGEMRLLIAPSLLRLVVLGLDVVALFFVDPAGGRGLGLAARGHLSCRRSSGPEPDVDAATARGSGRPGVARRSSSPLGSSWGRRVAEHAVSGRER